MPSCPCTVALRGAGRMGVWFLRREDAGERQITVQASGLPAIQEELRAAVPQSSPDSAGANAHYQRLAADRQIGAAQHAFLHTVQTAVRGLDDSGVWGSVWITSRS
jgi:hypothetical protein